MLKTKLPRSVWLYLGILTLHGMVFYGPVSALYRQYRGVSYLQMTVIESISLGLSILLEIPWGLVADRIGYKRTLLVCNGVFFLSKIVFWQADGFGDFLIERILLAVVFAGFSGVDTAYLARLVPPEQHQRVFGLCRACETVGIVTASLLLPLILDEGYRTAALLTTLAYGGALLLTLPLAELPLTDTARRGLRAQLADIRRLLPRPRLVLVLAGAAVLYEVNQSFLGQLLYQRAGIPERWYSLLFLLLMLLGLTAPLSARVTRLCGQWGTPLALLAATGGCCLLLWATTLPLWTVLGLCGINLCYALYLPWQRSWQAGVTAEDGRATALSVQSSLTNLLCIGIELTFGRLSAVSIGLTMGAAGIFCLLGIILLLIFVTTNTTRKGS